VYLSHVFLLLLTSVFSCNRIYFACLSRIRRDIYETIVPEIKDEILRCPAGMQRNLFVTTLAEFDQPCRLEFAYRIVQRVAIVMMFNGNFIWSHAS